MAQRRPTIVKGNTVTIYKMDHPACVSSFIVNMQAAIRYALKQSVNSVEVICLCAREHIFPDACLPISALIQEFKIIYNIEINVIIKNNHYLETCNFTNPLNLPVEKISKFRNPLNKIFVYEANNGDSPQAVALNQAFGDCISRTVACEKGVLGGLTWCIYEVMDNVLLHSKSKRGYVMAQYHTTTQRLAICVYDCGIGIYNSLSEGETKPESEIDAIKLAIQEGVGDGQGQGNGLYGSAQIINVNGGRLVISSGKSTLMYKNGEFTEWTNNPIVSNEHRGTIVDFQVHLTHETDLKEALKSIGGIDDFDIRIDEDMAQVDSDWLVYNVKEYANDTGTRASGKELRLDVTNIINRKDAPMIIDFSNIDIVSSSFIDEFLAKLYMDFGNDKFSRYISVANMNEEIKFLFNRSLQLRTDSND